MRHRERPRRVAAFVAESVNIQQMQSATEALHRHNRRAVLVSDQHALLRGYNGNAEINFAVAQTTEDTDPSDYDALILLDGASRLKPSAVELSRRFGDAGKPVVALSGSADLLAGMAGTDAPGDEAAAAMIDGTLYQSADDDCDWKILDAVGSRLQGGPGDDAAPQKRRA